MDGRMILYRGSLKSCNYRCSYCPFSKHRISGRELEKDQEQWLSFAGTFGERAEALGIRALMVVPYGEALIHPWYWEGLAHISALPGMDAVGAQTNLSFPAGESLARFTEAGGMPEKLRLWATFHPEMASLEEFVESCVQLKERGVLLSAGAVGVPNNVELLRRLRRELPEEIYLWINEMDGLGRPYTREEKEAFLGIDPYFARELIPVPADADRCRGRLFVEGDGRLHTCNISRTLGVDWETFCDRHLALFPAPQCGRKRCSCYLAYGGREDFVNRMLFGPYPLFRIPRRPKAVFLDIEGTLLPDGKEMGAESRGLAHGTEEEQKICKRERKICKRDRKICLEERKIRPERREIPDAVLAALEALSREETALFFATTLPYGEAVRRCGEVCRLFRGGIFAGGSHIVLEKADGEEQGRKVQKEFFYFMEEACLASLEAVKGKFSFRLLAYRSGGRLYKVTLLRTARRPWDREEAEEVFSSLPLSCRDTMRYFIEGNCLQLVSAEADKANGVRMLCQWLHISPGEAFAAGDSGEDAGMMGLCGR